MSFLVYLGGGTLLAALLRWWRPAIGWGWIGGYWLLAGAFFAAPLTTDRLQVPTDIAYLCPPWRETVRGPVVPANPLLGDVPLQMIPFRALTRDRLLRLEAPLWAHEIGTGQPLLGNAQSAPFSVFGILTVLLPPVRALPVAAALRLFVSLLLMHALLIALGAGRAGAALAAIAFTFSVFSICWAYHPHGMAIAWLPGIVLGLVLLHRRERGGATGLVVCGLAMAACGHPETLAHAGLAAAAVAATLLLRGGDRGRFLRGLAGSTIVCAALAAPILLPVLDAIPESVRAQLVRSSHREVEPPAFSLATAVVIVDPLAFGSPRDHDWSGPPRLNYNELASGYAGLLTLALALAAALALRRRLLAIVAGGALALVTAFGVQPFLAALEAVPPFGQAANARLRFVWVLAVAVAAGLSLEPLLAERRGRWVAAGVTGALALGLGLLRRPEAAPWQRAWWVTTVAGSAVVAAVFLWAALRRDEGPGSSHPPRWLPWLTVGALVLDLGMLNLRFLPVLPPTFDLAPPPAVAALMTAMADAPTPFRVAAPGIAMPPNLAALYGLWDPRGDDPMQPAGPAEVIGPAFLPHYTIAAPVVLLRKPLPLPLLRFLGVRYLLLRHGEVLVPPAWQVWDGAGGTLAINPGALPLFFMPASWRAVVDRPAAIAATVANQDFASAAVVEAEGAELPAPGPPRPPRDVRLAHLGANGFRLHAADPAGGLVASSISFSRSWRLTIDARPARMLRVNGGFLGFIAPPGWRQAELDYRPAGWTWGLRLFATTLGALLVAFALRALRRRPGRGLPAPPQANV